MATFALPAITAKARVTDGWIYFGLPVGGTGITADGTEEYPARVRWGISPAWWFREGQLVTTPMKVMVRFGEQSGTFFIVAGDHDEKCRQ